MPELKGIDLIKQVRSVDPRIPIYVLSSNTDEEEQGEALAAGANGWFSKPITASALSQIL